MTNMCGIYEIRNTVNGKVYVGSSRTLRKRKHTHFSELRRNVHHSSHLQYAFNKYGEDAFIFTVLEYCDEEGVEDKEAEWILKLKANDREYGYNARVYVTNNLGLRHTEETKRRMSESRRGKGTGRRQLSAETRKFMSEKCRKQNLQQYHTEETERYRLERLRETIVGKPLSDEHKESIRKHNRGEGNGQSKLTEEDVVKIKGLLNEGGRTQTEIAGMFNVSRRTIGFIKSGERWGHVIA